MNAGPTKAAARRIASAHHIDPHTDAIEVALDPIDAQALRAHAARQGHSAEQAAADIIRATLDEVVDAMVSGLTTPPDRH